ncbi:STAS domain-containing protein [Ruania suaedae]|uniref:STAS domain-containing protein n=1 Tax=Ruania suaedae TaxID=2897774 RepID=UPI001E3F9550|nr:STAS domain-containing protein [Ruania suaedae]UFU02681.1 STAS domain-containing protein [Ruania suaedae]
MPDEASHAEPTVQSDLPEPPEAGTGVVQTLMEGEYTRMVLSGEIDVSMSTELGEAVAEAERAGLPVHVDVRHVVFMDSAGVALLARLASHTPGRPVLIRPPDVVRFLLEATHIGDLVDVVEHDPQR